MGEPSCHARFRRQQCRGAGRAQFSPADLYRRQVLQLARQLAPNGTPRLERLRGFGAPLGGLVTCGCARIDFSDGSEAILVTATEPAGRTMPLIERLQRLIDGNDMPIAVFARDGLFVGASEAARKLLGFRDLTEAGFEQARHDALTDGYVEMPISIGHVTLHMILQRLGAGADIGLLAFILPQAPQQTPETVAEPDASAIEGIETADTGTDQRPASQVTRPRRSRRQRPKSCWSTSSRKPSPHLSPLLCNSPRCRRPSLRRMIRDRCDRQRRRWNWPAPSGRRNRTCSHPFMPLTKLRWKQPCTPPQLPLTTV